MIHSPPIQSTRLISPGAWQRPSMPGADAGGGGGGASLDAEVLDWIARVQGQGSDVSAGSRTAANTFMLALKANNLRSKSYRIGIYLGNDLNALKAPFIKDAGNTLDTLANFVAGDYSEATGLTGDLATKALLTGVAGSAFANLNSVALAVYITTAANQNAIAMGCQDGTPIAIYLIPAYVDGNSYFACGPTGNQISAADSAGRGFYVGSRTAANAMALYKNGAQIAATSSPGGSSDPAGTNIAVHAYDVSGVTSARSSKTFCFYGIFAGLTATDVANLYNAVQAVQTSMNRNV